jgi:hypothetical protein
MKVQYIVRNEEDGRDVDKRTFALLEASSG